MNADHILYCLGNVEGRYVMEAAPDFTSRSPSAPKVLKLWQKLLIAALLAVTIPLAALAAADGLGLIDYLTRRGYVDTEAAQALTVGPDELYADSEILPEMEEEAVYFSTADAKFTVSEAICDGQTIYLLAKVKPADESVFLIPQYLSPEDPTSYLVGMEAPEEGTIGEYAAALGKSLAVASISYRVEDTRLDGGEDYLYDDDGNLYYYFTAPNTTGSAMLSMDCTGISYRDLLQAQDRSQVAFGINLREEALPQAVIFGALDPRAYEDTGIQIRTLTLEETLFGLYATFEFSTADAAFTDIDFHLTDASGDRLPSLPGIYGTGQVELGDGIYSITVCFQKPENTALDELCFVIRDFSNAVSYGPYDIE